MQCFLGSKASKSPLVSGLTKPYRGSGKLLSLIKVEQPASRSLTVTLSNTLRCSTVAARCCCVTVQQAYGTGALRYHKRMVRLRYGTVRQACGAVLLRYGTASLGSGAVVSGKVAVRLRYGTIRIQLRYGTIRIQLRYGTASLRCGAVVLRFVALRYSCGTVTLRYD